MPLRGTVGCASRRNAATPPTSPKRRTPTSRMVRSVDVIQREMRVRSFVEEVWNKRNYEAAVDLYSDAYVNGFGVGPAARVEPIRRYHGAFPDLSIEIDEIIVSADAVVVRSTFRGTDTGGYAGRAPTGQAVDEWVVTIMHFEGGKVVREWI